MAKRFTDTDKWTNNKWFYELSPELKLFWIYILDTCDNVGVWEENTTLASIIIGYQYPMDTLLKAFEKQIYIFRNGRKWWIVDFCDFQYGKLSEDSPSKPVQSYIRQLKDHGLWIPYTKGIQTHKEKEKDKDKEKEKEIRDVFDEFWTEYHKLSGLPKTDREAALKHWNKLKESERDLAIKNIDIYIKHCKPGYIKKARTYLADKNFNDDYSYKQPDLLY